MLVHVGLIIFLIFTPKIFPPHVPTQQEIDLARQQLTYVLPPRNRPRRARPPAPKMRISSENLEQVAPPVEQPAPPPAPTPAPAPRQAASGIAGSAEATAVIAPLQPHSRAAPSQLEPIKPEPQSPIT